jgi:hypothetical protein
MKQVLSPGLGAEVIHGRGLFRSVPGVGPGRFGTLACVMEIEIQVVFGKDTTPCTDRIL